MMGSQAASSIASWVECENVLQSCGTAPALPATKQNVRTCEFMTAQSDVYTFYMEAHTEKHNVMAQHQASIQFIALPYAHQLQSNVILPQTRLCFLSSLPSAMQCSSDAIALYITKKSERPVTHMSCSDVVVSRFAHFPDPLIHLIAALLPDLKILHPQPRSAVHGHLRNAQQKLSTLTICSDGQPPAHAPDSAPFDST